MSFRLPNPVPVENLGIDSGVALWQGSAGDVAQTREAKRAGLELEPSDDCITLTPGSVASWDALRRFRKVSDDVAGDVVGRLGGPLAQWCDDPCFGPPARMIRLRGGGEATAERLAKATEVVIEADVRTIDVPTADGVSGRVLVVHLSNAVLCSRHHWTGVLWSNLLMLGPALWRDLVGPPWLAVPRLMWAVGRTLSLNRYRIAGAMSRRGRGVDVHPSAVVEASWLGDGCRVGPGAIVRGSILAPGVHVEPQGIALCSVLGPASHVQRGGKVQFSVVHGGGIVAGACQMGVMGPSAALKIGALLMDLTGGPPVRIRRAGELHEVPHGVASSGVGRNTLIGGGVFVAPGRNIPPDRFFALPTEQVLRIVDDPQ